MANDKQFKIPYGESNFELIRTEGFFYVDKTQFIPRLEGLNKVIHLRPRRIGKSLFVSMLECYYDVKSVDKLKQEALDQIFEKKYYVKLSGNVLCVGLAHSIKECELVS